jgi:HlyD family secretion protein
MKILTFTICVVIATAGLLILKPFFKKKTDVSYNTVKVEKGRIASAVTATGTIQAIKTVNVGTQVSGIVQHLYADFNDHVRQGQLLAKLDTTALKAQLDQSQALVHQAQAQLTYQEATYNRLKVLYDEKLISQADYDQALYYYENAKGALSNAESSYEWAKVNLDYATIYSPIDGVILNRTVEEGQTVAATFNTPNLFTIVKDLRGMQVQASVDEADIGKVKKGQHVEFTVDAYSDKSFEGSVSEVRLQPVNTNNVITYTVILNAPNPDKMLMPGMTASATIYIEEKPNALIIPGKALRFLPDSTYVNASIEMLPDMNRKSQTVWLKDEHGGLRPKMVTIGIDDGASVEIVSGLKEGDEVIISMKLPHPSRHQVKEGSRLPAMGPDQGG